jgi:hypothetical protein
MEELIKLVSQKTGLPQDKAKVAVDTVIGFLKQKLPPAIAGQIDTLLGGGKLPGDIASSLGGLLGGKK